MGLAMTDMTDHRATRAAGIALVVVSALVFSTAGPFTRGVEAGAWDIIFWRGIIGAQVQLRRKDKIHGDSS
jgi:hypothetical protein